MENIKEDNHLLASLAVFRELYNSEKDVYGIISVFLSDLIKNNNLYSFSLNEITNKLNTVFEFNIPDYVVKTSLGRLNFLEKIKADYIVTDISKINVTTIDIKQQLIQTNNEAIIDNLFKFIENEKKVTLTSSDKEKISHSFCCFLLDHSNGDEYIEYITAFILKNSADINFKSQLNLIREGVILYNGIKYNNNLNDLGAWRTELTIYIETEILFHLAGFNGELHQSLANDFLTYIREINQKAQKKIIQLKYFQEAKDEIEGFFTKARYLLEGGEKPNPNITAMVSIINGCKSPSDILEKKSDFYTLLKANSIEVDTYKDYFNPVNHKYNIVSKEIIDKVSKELDKDAEPYLKCLNYISIHRREANSNNFENIGSILLSGNSTTIKVSWNDLLKDEGFVPLATHLSFLTNKFWFKLNKGFGKNPLPKSFDIITKSQIILSKVLNDSVGEKYTELQSEFKSGKLTEDQAKARIIDLRNQVRKPEEIKNDTVKDVLSAITEDSLEKFIQEQLIFQSGILDTFWIKKEINFIPNSNYDYLYIESEKGEFLLNSAITNVFIDGISSIRVEVPNAAHITLTANQSDSYQLTGNLIPGIIPTRYEWKQKGNNDQATVISTATSIDDYKVTQPVTLYYTALDACGYAYTDSILLVSDNFFTAMDASESNLRISMVRQNTTSTFTIYNAIGQEISATSIAAYTSTFTLPVAQLSSGVYLCSLDVDGKRNTKRWVKR